LGSLLLRDCVAPLTRADNEFINLAIAPELYKTAKELDPDRFVNTADGVFDGGAAKYPNPVDFRSTGFELRKLPLGDPGMFSVAGTPAGPVINHEVSDHCDACHDICVLGVEPAPSLSGGRRAGAGLGGHLADSIFLDGVACGLVWASSAPSRWAIS